MLKYSKKQSYRLQSQIQNKKKKTKEENYWKNHCNIIHFIFTLFIHFKDKTIMFDF